MKRLSVSKKIVNACVAAGLAILLFFVSENRIPILENQTDRYFTNTITKAGLAYATCRVVNASVSILKESSLQLEPAGIGLSLALGQALDPIDDMTERLSDVLVTAITALGVQKLIYEISQVLALKVLATLLIIWALFSCLNVNQFNRIQQMIFGLLIIVAVIRMTLPLSAFANAFIQQHFFEDRISASTKALSGGIKDLDHLKEISLPRIDGIKGTLDNSALFLKQKIQEVKSAMASITQNMGMIIDNLLTLMLLYVGIFCIQIIFLPIITFWVLIKATRAFFDIRVSSLSHYLSKGENHAIREH